MSLLDEIKVSYNNGNLIPFIGAGFPMNIDDFPSWNHFVDIDLGEELKLPEGKKLRNSFNGDNIRATEYYVYKKGEEIAREEDIKPNMSIIIDKGKNALTQKLAEKFDDFVDIKEYTEKWSAYKEFISLNKFSTIYTTNWDRTLEAINGTLQSKDRYSQVIGGKKLREYLNKGDKRLLIKYHGDYKHHETVIATQTDYFNRLMHRNILDIKLQHDLLHYDFLFLGFSFEDVFIRYILYQTNYLMRDIEDKYCPKIFLVYVGEPNKIVMDYHKLSRIESYPICEINECPYIKECSKKEYSYLFSWDEIPGIDSVRLIEFLKQKFAIDRIKTAKVNLEIENGRADEFIAKMENGKLNIYKCSKEDSRTVQSKECKSNLRTYFTEFFKSLKKEEAK